MYANLEESKRKKYAEGMVIDCSLSVLLSTVKYDVQIFIKVSIYLLNGHITYIKRT